MAPEKGYPVLATVKSIRGCCNAGHAVGDVLQVSARHPGNLCGYMYHAAFPMILMLQFGGAFPWGDPDRIELDCPDKDNLLTIELCRVR